MREEPRISDYLRQPARSMREACLRAGRDEGGWRCPDCQLRRLCFDQSRWLVKQGPLPSQWLAAFDGG